MPGSPGASRSRSPRLSYRRLVPLVWCLLSSRWGLAIDRIAGRLKPYATYLFLTLGFCTNGGAEPGRTPLGRARRPRPALSSRNQGLPPSTSQPGVWPLTRVRPNNYAGVRSWESKCHGLKSNSNPNCYRCLLVRHASARPLFWSRGPSKKNVDMHNKARSIQSPVLLNIKIFAGRDDSGPALPATGWPKPKAKSQDLRACGEAAPWHSACKASP
jgi:hypothetical protein